MKYKKKIQMWIKEITTLPIRLYELTVSLDELELLTKTYRGNK